MYSRPNLKKQVLGFRALHTINNLAIPANRLSHFMVLASKLLRDKSHCYFITMLMTRKDLNTPLAAQVKLFDI